MRWEEFASGDHYGPSSFDTWNNHPVPNTFMEEMGATFESVAESSIISLAPGHGGGILGRMVQRSLMDDGEKITPEQINQEFPNMTRPILNSMTRTEARHRWERDQFEQYLGRKLSGDSPVWDWIPNVAGGLPAGFLDPVNWALGIGSYAALSRYTGMPGLLTAARTTRAGIKARGAAVGMVAAEGFLQGLAYGGLASASREIGGEYWTPSQILDEALYSGGFGALLGGVAYSGAIPAARVHAGAMMEGFKRTLKDETGAIDMGKIGDMGASVISYFLPKRKNMAAFAEGRNVDGLHATGSEAVRAMDVNTINVRPYELKRRSGARKDFLLHPPKDIKKSKFRVMNFNRRGLFSFGKIKWNPETPLPFYKGSAWKSERRGPLVPKENIKHLYASTEQVFNQDSFLLFETPEGAALWQMQDASDKAGGRFPSGPFQVAELSLHEIDGRTGVELLGDFAGDPAQRIARGKSVAQEVRHLTSEGRVFEVPYSRVQSASEGPLFDGVSDEVINFFPGKDWRKRVTGDDPATIKQEMADILSGKAEDSAPPAITSLMREYYRSHFAEENGTVVWLSEEAGDIHPLDIDWGEGKDGSNHREFLVGVEDFRFGMKTPIDTIREAAPGVAKVMEDFARKHNAQFVDGVDTGKIPLNTLAGIAERREGARADYLSMLKSMRDEGAEFPRHIDGSDTLPDTFKIIEDDKGNFLTIPGDPTKKDIGTRQSWVGRIVSAEADELVDNIPTAKYLLRPRELNLDVHPMSFAAEEVAAMEGIAADMDGFPVEDIIGDATYFEDGGVAIKEWVGRNKESLQKLNVTNVKWRAPDGAVETIPVFEGAEAVLSASEIRGLFKELRKGKPEEVLPEGVVKSAEETAADKERQELQQAFLERVKTAAGEGPDEYFNRLYARMKRWAGEDFDPEKYKQLRDDYVQLRKTLSEKKVGSRDYVMAELKRRELLHDMGIIGDRLKTVVEGGFDELGRFLTNTEEIKTLFRNSPETPYKWLGGASVEATREAIRNRHITMLIRRIEQAVGRDAFAEFQAGHFELDIRNISHHVDEKLMREDGRSGTVAEEGRESLDVNPDAHKIFEILGEIMERSHNTVLYSGFNRPAFAGRYIGPDTYARDVIERVGIETFVKKLMARAVVTEEKARDIFAGVTSLGGKDEASTLSDIHDFMIKTRSVRFKSGKDKYEFFAEFGQGSFGGVALFRKAVVGGDRHRQEFLGSGGGYERHRAGCQLGGGDKGFRHPSVSDLGVDDSGDAEEADKANGGSESDGVHG